MQHTLAIPALPAEPPAAAKVFYEDWQARAEALLREGAVSLVIIAPAAAADHDDWRVAAIRGLARLAAPARLNMIAGGSDRTRAEALDFLAHAPGVTGQYLPLEPEEPGD